MSSFAPEKPVSTSRTKRSSYLKWLLTLLVLGGLGAWGYFKGDELFAKLQEEWNQANLSFADFGYGAFFIGLVIYFLSVISTFYRWRILVRALDIPFSVFDCIRLGFVGYVGSQFAPGSITGDVFKAGFIIKEQPGRKLHAIASILVDRFVGLYSLFLLAALVGLFNMHLVWQDDQTGAAQLRIALLTIWGIAGGGLLALALFFFLPLRGTNIRNFLERVRFVGPFLSHTLAAFGRYRRHPIALSWAILMGMLGHIGFVLGYYFASLSLPGPGETPSWLIHFLIIPFFMVVQALPISFGGNLVIGDGVLGKLYELVGGMMLRGILASLLQRVIGWIVALIGLVWYIPLHRRMNAANRPASTKLRQDARLREAAVPVH
jgi:hypothetical protein